MLKFEMLLPMVAAGVAAGLAAALTASCATKETARTGTQVRVSAAIQADIEGLAGVRLGLNAAQSCAGNGEDVEDDDSTHWSRDLDISQLIWPDGTPATGVPNEYSHWLAETSFMNVVPGCYEVVAIPFGADGDPLLSCYADQRSIEVTDYASMVVTPPIYCGERPRNDMDVLDGNVAPVIAEFTLEPTVSTCDVTTVCATARDDNNDMLEFEWLRPDGFAPKPGRLAGPDTAPGPWPTVIEHRLNDDHSVTQCIAVQAHAAGTHDISLNVYDVVRVSPDEPPQRIEALLDHRSHASQTAPLDATRACTPTGRSIVILLTLDNNPGLPEAAATTLIGNVVKWVAEPLSVEPKLLVVLDDNHHGEDALDGEFVQAKLQELGYTAHYMYEPAAGLDPAVLTGYEVVWFVNPGAALDDPETLTALLRYRQRGGAVVLQGDDIARFRANPSFMEPLTYLGWHGNGAIACGVPIDNNVGDSYTVELGADTTASHLVMHGLEGLRFTYGNDIDLTRPLGDGEQVLAWANYQTRTCAVRTPVVVALDPEALLPW